MSYRILICQLVCPAPRVVRVGIGENDDWRWSEPQVPSEAE